MLELSPNKIQFTDNNQFNITIRNTLTDSAVAFKWMLTTPKSYTVKPRMGTIPAGESIDVVGTFYFFYVTIDYGSGFVVCSRQFFPNNCSPHNIQRLSFIA